MLELEGSAEIIWAEGGAVPGSAGGRGWRFTAERGAMHRGTLNLRWPLAAA